MDQYKIARAALDKKQLGPAERGFAAILKRTPRDVPATRSMAIVRFLQKRYADAIKLANHAITFDLSDAESPLQLVEFFLALKKYPDALEVAERACDDHIGSVLAWGTLLKVYRALNRGDEILPRMMRALDAHPDSLDLMLHIGNLHGKLGEHAKASAMFQRMLALEPGHADARFQYANTLYSLEQYDEAIAAYDAVLRVNPSHAPSHSQQGTIRITQRRPQEALAAFRLALRIDPNLYDALVGIGAALCDLNELEEAKTFLDTALTIRPHGVAGLNNLGHVLANHKRDAEAIALFDRVHAIEPESKINAKLSAATSTLRTGDYANGWRRYESRLTLDRQPVVDPAKYAGARRWTGEDLTGKTLLIVPEQGVGDTIQFCRYVPMAARATNALVMFAANRTVMPLLEGKEREWGPAGNLRIVPHTAELPTFDYFVLLMSLPMIFGTRVDTIPSPHAYLRAPEPYLQKWRSAVPERGKLRVGIVWSGNPGHTNDRNRSMPIHHLVPLLDDTSIDAFVIQPSLAEHDQLALAQRPHVLNGGPHIQDFGDTAALIEHLDVVISVDTSVAHVTGALGKRLFVMLPWAAEWRWFHDRGDSPWYASARLFRQASRGDWDSVVAEVRNALEALAREKATQGLAKPASMIELNPALVAQ